MAYADYEYYVSVYLGTIIPEPEFSRLSQRASSFLDYYTQGRAADNADLDALKMACCAIAEEQMAIDAASAAAAKGFSTGAEIQSETVGPHSVTYRSGAETATAALTYANNARQALAAIARMYLAGTGLLYRGGGAVCGRTP